MLAQFIKLPLCLLFLYVFVGCKSSPNAKLDFSDGSYEGQINSDGEKHGFGIYRWIDGSIYEGDYRNDLRHGKGRFLWANGESYEGDYLKDERTGKGTYNWPDGSLYKGEFLAGKRHGVGYYQSATGIVYEGEWFDDLQHGQGTLTYPDGRKTQGIWRKGSLISKPAILPTSSEKPKLPQIPIEQQSMDETEPDLDQDPNATGNTIEHPKILEPTRTAPSPKTSASNKPTFENGLDEAPKTYSESTEISSADEEVSSDKQEKETDLSEPTSGESDNEVNPDWTGTVAEAETFFITELVDGFDTVRVRASGIPFSGIMRIVDSSGVAKGEVNLLQGRMHGEEIFYNQAGEIIERNFWANGRLIGQ